MSLTPGIRIGPYEVVATLGEGGMGQVYRARDVSLGREVALKVLPDAVAHDPERIARFRREAQMLAALNHPLIASIYGVEEAPVGPVLVLELVEGPTLADRIDGSELSIDETLTIAEQIARALEAAHDQGIIHRDLKPANIKLRPDGTVKVLDFGLAKALEANREPGARVDPSHSPTITSPAMTARGVILGTATYMSPEQARGLAVDRGADIWAFGAVLFEMLTRTRAFDGDDPTQTVAAVLKSDPDWSRLPLDTPDGVRRVLRRCLEKDRRRRLGDIRDARLDIEEAQSAAASPRHTTVTASRTTERLVWAGALASTVIAAALWTITRETRPETPAAERRVEITTPPTFDPTALSLSPDGEKLTYVATVDGRTQLWLRMLDTGANRALPNTDGARFPFWSPDSRSIGFFAAEKLRRIDLDASVASVIGPAVIGPGATWNRAGDIIYSMVPDSPLYRVSANGGLPTPQPGADFKGGGQRYPQFLPDGRHFLYFVAESRAVLLGSLDRPERRKLFDADAAAVFAPPSDVLFVRGGVLYAQHFDTTRLRLDGEPVPVASGVASHPYGGAPVSASAAGSIAYRTGSATEERQFVWLKRDGTRAGVVGPRDRAAPLNVKLSGDGRQIAYSRTIDGNTDIWIMDVARGIPRRFTTSPSPDISPVWLPGDSAIIYDSGTGAPTGGFTLYVKPTVADGPGTPLFPDVDSSGIAMDYSRDGRFVLRRTSPSRQWDIWATPTQGDRKPIPLAQEAFDERTAQFSPDTRWIAYESNESGQYEIYIRPFPDPGARTRVSIAGGVQPRWRADGTELFYVSPDSRLMTVPVRLPSTGTSIVLGSPTPLFLVPVVSTVQGGVTFEYDIARDGQRFLVNTLVEEPPKPISLILNRRPIPR